jgi:uncharacterized phage protein (TIGR02220 family)
MRVVNSRFYEKRQVVNGTDGVVNGTDGVVNGTDGVVNGTDPKYKYIDKNKNKKKEKLAPQAAFITTHTPTEFENIRIVEGQTFDLEEKTNLEPITPAAGNLSAVNIPPDFPNEQYRKPRTPKPAGNSTDPTAETIAYLNEKAGTSFRANSKATKAQINARAKDGYTVEDFKAVIDFKTAEWGTDAKMMQYLCPETLFRASKFEGYLQAAKRAGMIGGQLVTRYSLEDRPQATTPTEMMKEAICFYQKNPAIWREATVFGKATGWAQKKHEDFLLKFCARQIADGRGRETFGEINARLQAWFLNEDKFQNATTTQHTAGTQPQAPLRSAAPVNYSPQGPQLRLEQKAE